MRLARSRLSILVGAMAAVVVLGGCSADGGVDDATQHVTGTARSADPTGPSTAPDVAATTLPTASPVRVDAMTQGEWERLWAEGVAACLGEAGWEVVVEPDGFTASVPPEQRGAYDQDSRRCQEEFAREHPLEPLTEADYRELYQDELQTVRCLEAAGYPPVRPPVSEQEYVAAYLAGQPPPWSAYEAFTGADLQEIEERCPQPSSFG